MGGIEEEPAPRVEAGDRRVLLGGEGSMGTALSISSPNK